MLDLRRLFRPPPLSPYDDPRWARRKRKYARWHRQRCRVCKLSKKALRKLGRSLDVHHWKYNWRFGRNDPRRIWRVPDRWLIYACGGPGSCHGEITPLHQRGGLTPLQATIAVAKRRGAPLLALYLQFLSRWDQVLGWGVRVIQITAVLALVWLYFHFGGSI